MSKDHALAMTKAKRLLVGTFVFVLSILSCSPPEQLLRLIATPTAQRVVAVLTPVTPSIAPTATATEALGEQGSATATVVLATPTMTRTSTRAVVLASRTRTPIPATATATALAVAPGVYATGLKVDPPAPKAGQRMTFTVTFLNTTGLVRDIKWYVTIFKPDQRHSVGETSKISSTLNVGSSMVTTGNDFRWGGMPSCEPYIAKVYALDEFGAIYILNRTDGSNLTHEFSICP